jgi:photosystem II stability/assembly factor-like uncharacterized protein
MDFRGMISSMTARFAALGALCLLPVAGFGQASPPVPQPESGPWSHIVSDLTLRQVGPTNMGGRIMDLAVYDKDPRIFYMATASGGLWKTVNAGVTTESVFDRESVVSLGSVAVQQNNPDVVWVGTGEASSRNSTAWGAGVYKSTDGGKTWSSVGLKETRHIVRIVIHPKNPNIVYVGATGNLWGPNSERGVYKTTDGGKTWTQVLKVNDLTGVSELIMDSKRPDTLIAGMWQRLRKPYDWVSGGEGSGIYKTTNGGKSWKKIEKGLPPGPYGRIGLHYFVSDPKVVVATVEHKSPPRPATPAATDTQPATPGTAPTRPTAPGQPRPAGQPGGQPGGSGRGQGMAPFNGGGTYLSQDGGETWTLAAPLNPRPFYFSQPHIDPVDKNRIYVLGVSLHVSDDMGKTFRTGRINIHADNHALWVNPSNNNHLIIGNDGGVYISHDRGLKWHHVNNMPLGQFYAATFDMRKPFWVYGGLQDNGSWGQPTETRSGGPSFADAFNVGGGDGFHVMVDPTNHNTVYGESQGGAIFRIDQKTGETRFIRPRGTGLRFNWSSPFIISPYNPFTLYFGGNRLFKTVDRGDNWKPISPDLTTNDPTKLQVGRQSVTPEDTGAERHCTITTISESRVRQGVLWVGTDDGLVWVTQDDGQTWTQVTANISGLPANTWCSRVTASRFVEGRAYATFDGHRSNDFKPYIYVTEDFGKTWTSLAADLPVDDCLYVVREGERNPDLLYLGSEMSLRVSLDRGKSWQRIRGNFPTVAVHDVQIHPRDLQAVIGTHGRSIWLMDCTGLESMTTENLAKDLVVAKPRPVYFFGRTPGAPWDGDSVYQSANTQPGCTIFYYLKDAQAGSAKVVISDITGTINQELSGGGKKGLNAVNWNGRIRGRIAEPGDYRITVSVGGKDAITSVKVEDVSGN